MTRYLGRRLLLSAVLLVVACTVVFVALRAIPGDPTSARLSSPGTTAAQVAQLRKELGVDRPVVEQYVNWLGDVARLDFGRSYYSARDTSELIGRRIVPTIELALASMLIAVLLAVPTAILVALRPGSRWDRLASAMAAAGLSTPSFCLGILLIGIFGVELGWFPTRGYVSISEDPLENLRYLFLPALTTGILIAAPMFRFLRAALIDVATSDYVRTAQGKGLTWNQAMIRHALPNALPPTIAFAGVIVGHVLGGVVIIEYVFGWQGLGALAVEAVAKRDYAVLQGVVVLAVIAFLLVSLVVDLLTLHLNPRARASALR